MRRRIFPALVIAGLLVAGCQAMTNNSGNYACWKTGTAGYREHGGSAPHERVMGVLHAEERLCNDDDYKRAQP